MQDVLTELGCIPLAEHNLTLGRRRERFLPLGILVAAMLLAAFQVVPVAIAFFAAVTAIAVLRVLPLRDIYDSVDWAIIVLLGCMIPVGESVQLTGGSELIAHGLAEVAGALPPWGILALAMIVSMQITAVLQNAAAVLVLGPSAASLGAELGFNQDPFLMVVAVGAASDFLTPIGHQCNTLVMAPSGYRFSDYRHLGLPLSALVVATGVPLIMLFWPLT